jgi:hypothetical protein
MTSQTQPAVQPLQKGRPFGSWQKSEVFVVAMIPCRTFGLENPRGSEGTSLVPQQGRATKNVVTALRGYQRHASSGVATPCWPCGLWPRGKELGKPDAGKPPVRFDEGREDDGHGLSGLSLRLFPPTLHTALKGKTAKFLEWGMRWCGSPSIRRDGVSLPRARPGGVSVAAQNRINASASQGIVHDPLFPFEGGVECQALTPSAPLRPNSIWTHPLSW